MISPKLIFQCSSASLLAATVVAAPMWLPEVLTPNTKDVIAAPDARKDDNQQIRVEPHQLQPVLRAADGGEHNVHHQVVQLEPADRRSLEERNKAANQVLGELENTLEHRDSPEYSQSLQLHELLESSDSRVIRCHRGKSADHGLQNFDIIRDE